MSNAGGMKSLVRYHDMLAGNPVYAPVDFEAIMTATVDASGSGSISFSSIPQTYKHLQIRAIGRSASTSNGLWLQFNGDSTSSNYGAHALYGSGSGSANALYLASTPIVSYWPVSSDTASVYGSAVIDVLDYTSTSKTKTVRALGGYDANGSGYVWMDSELWTPTPVAVTSITMLMASSNNLAPNSSFALYGIKG